MLTLFGEQAVCSKGWGDRCAHAKSGRCSCACGGANHGSQRFMTIKNEKKENTIVKEKAHFFLTFIKKAKEAHLGQEIIVLADFSGIPAGSHGHISEIYTLGKGKNAHSGVMVEWVQEPSRRHGPTADGFGQDELEYLAFGTPKHPKVM